MVTTVTICVFKHSIFMAVSLWLPWVVYDNLQRTESRASPLSSASGLSWINASGQLPIEKQPESQTNIDR
jgi:hypothetical protein